MGIASGDGSEAALIDRNLRNDTVMGGKEWYKNVGRERMGVSCIVG
ncbi:MAG: hypothetical protein AAGI03_12490 [Pseudomonadota bacterium]